MSIYRLKCIHRLYIIYHHETGRRRAVLMTFHYVYYCQVIVFDYIRRYMRTVQSKSKSNQIKYVTLCCLSRWCVLYAMLSPHGPQI